MSFSCHSPGPPEELNVPSEVDQYTRRTMENAIKDERVINAKNLHEQIGWLCTILRNDDIPISLEKIGKLFNPRKSHATINRHWSAFKKPPKEPKRPELLTEEQYQTLSEKIREAIAEYGHPSLCNIVSFIRDSFEIEVSRSSALRILEKIGFKLMKATPLEEDRYECKIDDIIEYYRQLGEILKEIPCGFCFNLDESGIQRYVDARDTYLVVPVDFPDQELKFPVYRAAKRITLLHCISTDGSYIPPLIVLPRKTCDSDVFDYINPNSCRFCSQENGFLTAELFEYWLYACFFPELEKKREKFQYFGDALIIMDGFKGHTKAYEANKELFEKNNVKVLFIPPHSSDQVQPLDILGFNLLKLSKSKTSISFMESASDQTREIVRIMNALESISTSPIITKAWHSAGIYRSPIADYSFNRVVYIQYHEVDIEKAKKIRVHDEENKQRVKSFAENFMRTNKHDIPKILPNPIRFKTPDKLTKAQIEWFHQNKDKFIDYNKALSI